MRLYHIDRMNKLKSGDIIKLNLFNDIKGIDNEHTMRLKSTINSMFEEGISYHGARYLFSNIYNKIEEAYKIKEENIMEVKQYCINQLKNINSEFIEIIFEMVRNTKYNNCVSRFEAFFATDKESIVKMCEELNVRIEDARIFEIECDGNQVKYDMKLLRGVDKLDMLVNCDLYWSRERSISPIYEYLLKPPIKIGRLVTINEIFNEEQ